MIKSDYVSDLLGVSRPPLYNLYILNTGNAPKKVVREIMTNVFYKKKYRMPLSLSFKRRIFCGIYTREVLESKLDEVESRIERKRVTLMVEVDAIKGN